MIEEEKKCIENQLADIVKKIGLQNAFGDPRIVKIVRELNRLLEIIDDSTHPCPACDGTGGEKHHCSCHACKIAWENCEKCDGEGRI